MKILSIATIILAVLLLMLFAFSSFLEIKAIQEKIKEINQLTELEKDHKEAWFRTPDSAINQAQMEKAFLLSQQEVSRSNSIVLILNFPDSLAALSIKGLHVHNAKIQAYAIDPIFKAVNPVSLMHIFSKPLKITEVKSSIKKVPLMIKIAPRDTSEYTPDLQADTSDTEVVNYVLQTSYGTQLFFNEINPATLSKKANFKNTDVAENLMHNIQQIKSYVSQNKLHYFPKIQLSLSRKDAKIIYRAIPDTALLVLKILP